MNNRSEKVEGREMIGTEDGSQTVRKNSLEKRNANGERGLSTEELRERTQQLSLREQIERNHFLLERLYAASAGIIQALTEGDVHMAIGEILGNLIGSEEAAIFHYDKVDRRFVPAWSVGLSNDTLRKFSNGAGMMGRTVSQGLTQFRDRQNQAHLLPQEKNLTASVVLKSSREVVGVILIFGLLPQKNGLEWVDYQLLKFLETYGAVAIQLQCLQKSAVKP